MNIKKLIIAGGTLMLTYELGRIVGHLECLDNVLKNDILTEDKVFVDKIGKHFGISVFKPTEKENDECDV